MTVRNVRTSPWARWRRAEVVTGLREDDEAALPAEALHEVVVLHDRERPVAADALERRPADEDRLVAVDAAVEAARRERRRAARAAGGGRSGG